MILMLSFQSKYPPNERGAQNAGETYQKISTRSGEHQKKSTESPTNSVSSLRIYLTIAPFSRGGWGGQLLSRLSYPHPVKLDCSKNHFLNRT